MSIKPASTSPPDARKTKKELLSELQELRAQLAVLSDAEANKINSEAFRGCEDRYRAFFENSIDAVFITTPDGGVESANPAACRMFGMTEEELIRVGRDGVVDTSDPRVMHAVEERARTGKFKGEMNYRRKDGAIFPGEVSTTLFKDGKGNVKTSLIVRDITERKRAEEALRVSEERYRSIVEMANEGIWTIDRDNVTTFVNPRMARMLGYSQEEIVGRMPYDFLDDAYREEVRNHLDNRRRGARGQYTCKYLRKDGSDLWAIVSGTPLYDGNGAYTGAMAMITDITERKRAEELLAQQANLLSMVYDGVWAVDAEFRFTYWNKGAERILGWTAEEALGKVANDLLKTRIEGASMEESIKKMLQDGHYEGEAFYLHKDGRYVPVEVNFSVVKGPDGEMRGLIVTGRDITDRKRAEEELKKYGVILANLRDIVYFVRLDGSIIEVNDAAVRAYGYSRDELLSMNVSDLRIPSERAVLPDFLKRCYENGCLFETVHQQRDGSTFPVEISSRGIELNGQKVLIGVGRDITKRRQAEDAIRTNAINLARAENLANLGHWDWDLTTNKVKWSDGHFRIFGYPVAHDTETYEMWQDRVHPDDIDGVEKMLREGMEKGTSYSCNFRTLLPDGSIRYLHAEADKPVMDESGRPVRWFGIVQDITERKRADEALKESEERFRTTFEQSAVGMTQVSLDGRFLLVNKKYCDITGYSEDELLGLTVADITYPADVVVESEKINRLLAGELDTFSSDKRYVRKDGSLIWVKLTVALVRDQGKPNYMTGVTEDITQRKRAEEELVEAKKHAELYVDLMGHDINNLNQVALGYLELAVEMVKDDEVRDIVKKPLDAIQNSSKLIENVRKLQRLKTGGLKIEAIDVGGLLVELRDQYLNMPGKDIVIDYSPLGDCYVMANGLLRDVFSNLIGNAIKHSGSSKSVLIGLGLERVGDDGREYCRVIVEDDGPGIPDVQKEKVFERFRKEDAKASGKGLGLYLVKSLVEDFHGTVHVEDRIKGDYTQGARFVVMLPAIEK